MNTEFGMKELYDLTLKATYKIEMGGRVYEPGEVIARFDKIQLANFQEVTDRVSATGGYDNRAHVTWEDSKEVRLNFTQGIFSKTQFALLSNSSLIQKRQDFLISGHYEGESNDRGLIKVNAQNIEQVFVYNKATSEKIVPSQIDFEKGEIFIPEVFQDVIVDYMYMYKNGATEMRIGEKMIQGYLLLEGKTRVKDDITGKTHTAILRIPRLKLVSDLTMRLGREATPILASFNAMGLPSGQKGDKKIMELLFLNDDIDAEK